MKRQYIKCKIKCTIKEEKNCRCKACTTARNKKYYQENINKRREYSKKYYQENIDKSREYSKKYYQENTDKIRARHKEYHQENVDKIKDYNKEYHQENVDKVKARHKEYSQKHKDRINAYHKECRKEYRKEYNKEYRKKNRGQLIANNNNHRISKLHRVPKWLTNEQKQQIMDFYVNCPKDMVVDHIIPLRGKYISGLHLPGNLQYLIPSENKHKRSKYPPVDNRFLDS